MTKKSAFYGNGKSVARKMGLFSQFWDFRGSFGLATLMTRWREEQRSGGPSTDVDADGSISEARASEG